MTNAQYAAIKQKAAQLMPAAAPGLGLTAVGLRIVVDNTAYDKPQLVDDAIPPTVRMNEADYRDLIVRLRAES